MKKLSAYLSKVSIGLLFTIQTINISAQDTLVVFKTTDPDMFLYNYNYVDSLCDPEMFGTLQWAIRKLNDSPNPCVITFAIPGIGQHIINMNYELPAISNKVTIDGTSQGGYAYGNPSVIINGTENIPQSFSLYSYDLQHRSDSCIIKGLQIQNFYISGIMLFNSGYCQILDNVIINITNASPDMATMGIRTLNSPYNTIAGNFIGTNSTLGSGFGCDNYGIYIQTFITIPDAVPSSFYLIGDVSNGNIIAYNGTAGITISNDCSNNQISGNKIFNNPIGISLTYGANQNKQAPIIISATNSTVSGTSVPNDIIEIFGSTGNENANEYLASGIADSTGNWTFHIVTTFPYFIVTTTDISQNTSPLSNIINSNIINVTHPTGIAYCGTSTKSIFDFNKKYYDYANNLDTTQVFPKNERSFLSQDQFPLANIILCGDHFRLFYDDFNHSPGGFTDPTLVGGITIGEQRRNTLCAVLEYIESVIEIPAGERIDIFINQSYSSINPITAGSSMLALGGPYYLNNTYGISQGVYNGNVYNHIKYGFDPDINNYDALLQVNFDQYWDVYANSHPAEYYDDYQTVNINNRFDLYSILLHEVTHMLGWVTGISEDLAITTPYSNPAITNNNSFTLYDWNFLFQGDILNPVTLNHLVGGTLLSPILQINNSINDPLRQNNIWLNSSGIPTNHPVYSGCLENSWFLNSSSRSLLCHLNYSVLSFHSMAQYSPGFQPRYVMGPYFGKEEMRREWTLAEWRALSTLDYTFTDNFLNFSTSLNGIDLNSDLLNNTPPFRANNNNNVTKYSTTTFDGYFPESQFAHSIFTPNYPSTPSMIINIPSDPALLSYDNIQENDGDPISIMPNSLFGIRGVSDCTNSHARLVINGTGTQIEYTPEPGYIGKAQFGFNLWDGHECGSLIIYTIDVQPSISLPFSFGDELVINGGYEDGTEVRQNDGIHYSLPYTSLHDWYEGEYYRGYHFAGAHPYSYMVNLGNLCGGTFVENTYKQTLYLANPFHLGDYGWGSNSSNFLTGNSPIPLPNPNNPLSLPTNERFEMIRPWWDYSFSTLKNNIEPYHKYQFNLDLSFNSDTWGSVYTSGQNFTYKIQFTTDPGTDPNNVTVLQENTFSTTVQVLNTSINGDLWQPESGEITYCSPTPTRFFRIVSTDGNVFIDNISLKEVAIPPLTVSIQGNTSVCYGATTILSATPNNAICDVTYLWQPGGYTTPTITTPILTSTTSYSVTITDASGAIATNQVLINVNLLPTPSIAGILTYCAGSNSTLDASNVYTSYLWSTGATAQTIITTISDNPIFVVVTDANGCTGTSPNINLNENTLPTPVINGSLNYCAGSNTILDAGNGYTSYLWSTGVTTQTINATISDNPINVAVTNINGCVASASVIITVNPQINVSFISFDVTTFGGSNGYADLTVLGGNPPYIFNWSNGATTEDIFSLTAGSYSVIITDASGCTHVENVIINEPPGLTLTISETYETCPGLCNGTATVIVTGGIPPYTFVWNDPSGQQTSTAIHLCPGSYNVIVTDYSGMSEMVTANIITDPVVLYNPPPYLIISNGTTETWSGSGYNYTVNGYIEVMPDAQLTLQNCTLQFGANSGIIVHERGNLIIDNATLKKLTTCNSLWDGVVILGDKTLNQTANPYSPSNPQGFVRMMNSSVVENAKIGFDVGGGGYNNPNIATAGGVLWVESNSILRNNKYCAIFKYYNKQNRSRFINCQVIVDNSVPTNGMISSYYTGKNTQIDHPIPI